MAIKYRCLQCRTIIRPDYQIWPRRVSSWYTRFPRRNKDHPPFSSSLLPFSSVPPFSYLLLSSFPHSTPLPPSLPFPPSLFLTPPSLSLLLPSSLPISSPHLPPHNSYLVCEISCHFLELTWVGRDLPWGHTNIPLHLCFRIPFESYVKYMCSWEQVLSLW